MRWYRFGTDFFVCDCEKRKMYWMYIQFFGKKQAGKDVPKMCRRINQRFLKKTPHFPVSYRILTIPVTIKNSGLSQCSAMARSYCFHSIGQFSSNWRDICPCSPSSARCFSSRAAIRL